MKNIILSVTTIGLLSSCSGIGSVSSLNPFRRSPQPEEALITATRAPDGRELIATVAELRAEPTRNGVILRAHGKTDVQGYYDVELSETNNGLPDATGTLTFELRGKPPQFPLAANTDRSRDIVAGVFISQITLKSVKALRVVAAQNQITIRN